MRLLVVPLCLAAVLAASTAVASGGPGLTGARPCPTEAGFTCSTLPVPLDWSGRRPGTLPLAVAVANNAAAPHGVLLWLSGGPGQPAADDAANVARRLGPIAAGYRVVTFDQRGTGSSVLDCPELQQQMGYSDLQPPTVAAVRSCAARIGPARAFYGTDDTVRDIDALRKALGVDKLTIQGTSYGTYVAERYALAYPKHVTRLVLDSVVPQRASGQLETQAFPRVAEVLRAVCKERGCGFDPAADLAADVARYHNGPQLLDAIVTLSVFDPTYVTQFDLPRALHEARQGNPDAMRSMLALIKDSEATTPASILSQGLHASALCEDWTYPWGDSSAPLAGRAAALRRYANSLPTSAFWPFDRATVIENGIMQQCLYWPPTAPSPQPAVGAKLPPVPVLLLAGDRDLSTPLPWPKAELRSAPRGKLVLVHESGHGAARTAGGAAALRRFLLGP
jgi:pimeloyl-ACP methyl ester carboxylesterase